MTRRTVTSSSEPPRVMLLGGFGVGNIGNDASLEAGVELVRRAVPDAVIACACPQPKNVPQRLGVEAHSLRSPRPNGRPFSGPAGALLRLPWRVKDLVDAVRRAMKVDVLLVPGTGILDDYGGEKPSGWPLTLLIWLGSARAAGARTGLVSIGAGPLDHPVSRRLARWVGRVADYRSFRDEGSRLFMISTGLELAADAVVPDIAFSLDPPKPPVRVADRQLVAIAVMNYRGWAPPTRLERVLATYLEQLAQLCRWLLESGIAVRLVTADEGDGPAVSRLAEKVRADLPALASTRLSTSTSKDFASLMELMNDATVVVATRYHSVVAALMCHRPTVSLGYAVKNDELMALAGLGRYCQHVEHIDQERLRLQVDDLLTDEHQISTVVSTNVKALRDRLACEESTIRTTLLARPGRARTGPAPAER